MSQCIVPNWNLRHQRQEQVDEEEEEGNRRSSHVNNNTTTNTLHHRQHNSSPHLFPMSNYEVTELTWQNGQLAMQGLGGLPPTTPTKPTWGRSSDTLESIVHQATSYPKQNLNLLPRDIKTPVKISPMVASSSGKWSESSGKVPALLNKRARGDSDHQRGKNFNGSTQEDQRVDRSPCASASATFCKDNDTTMITWASYESPRSFKAKTTDEDSACHDESENQDEDHENKAETVRSHSSRRSRAAAIHNQSERRRRDRINQKMKQLQRLVPNASKTDKASMLDEVIDYLKKLQAQIQMMNSMRNNIPQMMMPLGMQQHLQMSLLARMAAGMGAVGLGMGMGTTMFDLNTMASSGGTSQALPPLVHHPSNVSTTTPNPFVPTPFMLPSMIAACPPAQVNPDSGDSNSVSFPDPYCALFAQSMNMELYNKMAALFRQQGDQAVQAMNCPSQQSNPVQGD